MNDRLLLIPAVELSMHRPPDRPDLPTLPWPHLLELDSAKHDSEFEYILLLMLGINNEEPEETTHPDDQASEFPSLPGGLIARRNDVEIIPSCCCGLEEWGQWRSLFQESPMLWLGHDPAPHVEQKDGKFTLWADGGLDDARIEPRIDFNREELTEALEDAERAISEFSGRFRKYLQRVRPVDGEALAALFETAFVITPSTISSR